MIKKKKKFIKKIHKTHKRFAKYKNMYYLCNGKLK